MSSRFHLLAIAVALIASSSYGQDTQAPTISGIPTVDPSVIDLSEGDQTITVSITGMDDNAGIQLVFGSFVNDQSSTGFFSASLISGTAQNGTWRAEVLIPARSEDGVYDLSLTVYDAANNIATPRFSGLLTVSGGDQSPPFIVGEPTVEPDTIVVPDNPDFTARDTVVVTVELADEGVGVGEVLAYLENEEGIALNAGGCDLTDGDESEGTWRCEIIVFLAQLNTPEAPETFSVSIWASDGAQNSQTNETNLEVAIVRGKTPVAFRVDMRRLERIGLFNRSTFFADGMKAYVDILEGPEAGQYELEDIGFDSVWSANVSLTPTAALEYSFAIDPNGDGVNLGDWVYERPGNPRSVEVTVATELDPVPFDDLIPAEVELGFAAQVTRSATTDQTEPVVFSDEFAETLISLNLGSLSNPSLVSVRRLTKDPGGSPPAGINTISSGQRWIIDKIPSSPQDQTQVSLIYQGLGGISEPASLRLLRRDDPNASWASLNTSLNTGAGSISATVSDAAGEFTIGSTSANNSLIPTPPAEPGQPNPADGQGGVPVATELSWQPVPNALTYDVYIWREDFSESTFPIASFVTDASVVPPPFTIERGETYVWYVVARNLDGETVSPRWTFTTELEPDLAISGVIAPSEGFSGREIELRWTVTNVSDVPTNQPYWADEVQLSADPSFLGDVEYIGSFENPSALPAGEAYVQEASVRLPDEAVGTYFLRITANGSGFQRESDRSNNAAVSAIQIAQSPLADLRISEILAPANAFSGTEIEISWTVQNDGEGDASSPFGWNDQVYLSDSPILNVETAEFVGHHYRETPLAAGASYSVTREVVLPGRASGQWYVIVETNRDEVVFEHGETANNRLASNPIAVTLTPPPDLMPEGLTGPDAATAGQEVSAEWTVTNRGPGQLELGAWADRLYLVPDGDPDRPIALATVKRRGSIGPDSGYVATATARIPDGLEGAYRLRVTTDWADEIFEHNFEGNNSTETALTLSRPPYPDLAVVGINAAAEGMAGSQLRIDWTVRNDGDGPTGGGWTDRVYLSSKAEFDTSAVPLVAAPGSQTVDPGASYRFSQRAVLPADRDGDLYLHVVTDADGGLFEFPDDVENNVSVKSIALSPYPPVDLAVTRVTAPGNARGGESVNVGWTVENSGEASPTNPVWDDVIYLSFDDDLDPDSDPVLARVRRADGLEAGRSYQKTAAVQIPQGAGGSFHVFVSVEATDSNPENNVGRAGGPISIEAAEGADLRVVSVDAPETTQSGQPVAMRIVVENVGPAVATGSWTDIVYLSTDRTVQLGDLPLATYRATGPLGPGEQYEISIDATPPIFFSGGGFLLVSLDDGEGVFEAGQEGNNVVAHEITVSLAPPSDLVVTDIEVPESAIPGEEASISWTVRNAGSNRALGQLRDAVYISEDGEWQVSDPLMATELRVVDLDPGESMTMISKFDLGRSYQTDAQGNVSAELPGVAPGDYRAIVRVDVQDNIRESDDGNNVGVSSGTVSTEIPLLPLDGSVDGTIVAGGSRFYRVEVPVEVETFELSLTTTGSGASNELFVSESSIPSRTLFDVSFQEPFSSSFDLVVPASSVDSSTHYVLLYGRDGPAEGAPFTLSARALEFGLDEIDQRVGGEGGEITLKMSGAAFGLRSRAFLERDGVSIRARSIVRSNTSELFATFDLGGAALGPYDVVLEKDESSLILVADSLDIIQIDTMIVRSVLPDAFEVVPKVSPEPVVELQLPEAVLINQEFRIVMEVSNNGNVDLVSPLVLFMTSPATFATVNPEEGETAGLKRILMSGDGPVAGILRPGETHSVLVDLVAPPGSGPLKMYAGLARNSGQAFDLGTELHDALLDSPDHIWIAAVDELERMLAGNRWQDYEALLAETASSLSEHGVIERDGLRLLMHLVQRINQSLGSPGVGVAGTEPSASTEFGKTEAVANPCFGIGDPPLPGLDCDAGQILADRTALTCAATGMATPQVCGGPHGALHLAHFLSGDGSTIVYDNDSGLAEEFRNHQGNRSYQSIHQQMSEKLASELTDLIRDVGCDNLPDLQWPSTLDDIGTSVPKPDMYLNGTDVPYYDPFNDPLPDLGDLRISQPGCNLITAFGGFQSAEGRLSNFRIRSMQDPGARRCDKPGCTVVWEALLTYEFGDLYEFDAGDAQLSDFDLRARNLQLCGSATPFKTKVIIEEPIGGIVRVPPERNECPEPPELPPFLFEPPPIIPVIQSQDPNDIVGPAGAGDRRWVSVSATLPYRIRFENDPKLATAPAQVVSIEQFLPDSTVDVRSFRLGEFGFGDLRFQPPANSAAYSEQIDLSDSLGIVVDVNAGLDVENNRVFWVLRTLDSETGRAPSNPFAGFLPVNDSLGSGEGYVSYTIRPNPQAKTGDVLLAKADIIFDSNEVIETPEVFNTIDAGLPVSGVVELPLRADSTTFEVKWGGRDDAGGSGVEAVDLYVSKDGGSYELVRQDLRAPSILFNGEMDHRYRFYTLSSDRAGNQESAAGKEGYLIIVGTEQDEEIPDEFSLGQNYPNPFNPSTTVPYALPENADVQMVVYTVLGQRVLHYRMEGQRPGTHTVRVDMQSLASGVYFYQLEAKRGDRVLFTETKKMVLVK